MIKEALQYVVGLGKPTIHKDAANREFTDRVLNPVNVNLVSKLEVETLGGFCDLIGLNFESFPVDGVLVVVDSHEVVRLIGKISDEWARRTTYAAAKLTEVRGFCFGQFMDYENFIIGLQAGFVQNEDSAYLLKLASNLSSERIRTSADDGISQSVALKAGVVLKGPESVVRNRVKLAPYRTFREVKQPESEFIFRLRDNAEGKPPSLALFEADGGAWKLEAMENIGRYLRVKLEKEFPVVI